MSLSMKGILRYVNMLYPNICRLRTAFPLESFPIKSPLQRSFGLKRLRSFFVSPAHQEKARMMPNDKLLSHLENNLSHSTLLLLYSMLFLSPLLMTSRNHFSLGSFCLHFIIHSVRILYSFIISAL